MESGITTIQDMLKASSLDGDGDLNRHIAMERALRGFRDKVKGDSNPNGIELDDGVQTLLALVR